MLILSQDFNSTQIDNKQSTNYNHSEIINEEPHCPEEANFKLALGESTFMAINKININPTKKGISSKK